MKIVAPISAIPELDMLLECGADELYCGIHTPEWETRFGGFWWINRRSPQGANLVSWADLRKVADAARRKNAALNVTLNAPFYPEASIPYLLGLAGKLADQVGVHGIIVADLNLLARLTREKVPLRIHLSSLGACLNSRSVEFFASLGVTRIILPRQLTRSEVRSIVTRSASPMEFEIFAVNDGCFYEEGHCQTTHVLGGPFCLTDWEVGLLGPGAETAADPRRGSSQRLRASRALKAFPSERDGEAPGAPAAGRPRRASSTRMGEPAENPAAAVTRPRPRGSPGLPEAHRECLREYLWYLNNCGSSFQKNGLPNGPCSLCWFGHFRDWGITAVKIVGREASFVRKMASLQLVKAVMDEVRSGAGRGRIARLARSLRDTPDYCDSGCMCYYGEP